MLTKLAVRYLTYRLKKDEGFWIGYKANIAMTFFDNYYKFFPKTRHSRLSISKFCNTSAEEFLNLWTRKDVK